MTYLVDPIGVPAAPVGGQGYGRLNEDKQARSSSVSIYPPDSVITPLLLLDWSASTGTRTTPPDVLPSTSATPSTSTTNTDRAPEPSLPSSSIASPSVAAAPVPSNTANNSDSPTHINLTTANASDVDAVHT
ncbi:hypothetical protein SprV_0602114900 [Sparganum proliferum]